MLLLPKVVPWMDRVREAKEQVGGTVWRQAVERPLAYWAGATGCLAFT